jgi:hypothetical protein
MVSLSFDSHYSRFLSDDLDDDDLPSCFCLLALAQLPRLA